ncbi:Gp19/Gp15/Gp42 family protein [Arthrobacter sp. ok362]|uniref:Gp19/Gp15/Gp42 family protein n=1 Tax=Arthrobacter sp. ok362 TaxID=1761745 RepID=UPI0008850927|nr:Gp19/Gp15/Gp42 family protein [Arthrobacter sp. ok362]SDK79283.1 Phage protein Gp19/Gp15/Gp42 [Arthrobacter sp. ok362]
MAADYATLVDLKAHWSGLPAADEDDATQKLHEASIEVRGNYPDVDQRITVAVADGGMDPDIPKLVVCRMVKRAMDITEDAPTAGFESVQFGSGPFSMGGKVLNPDGNLYLTAADKRLLGKSRPRRQAWTIRPGG